MSSIDPKILKRMQSEDSYMQSQTRGSRRVQMDRGQTWVVRFLPAKMGPEELWFARIARHWLNKLPIVCPCNTGADFGGDPDFQCPVCSLADELNESPDESIRNYGYKVKANPQYLTYCVAWEKNGVQQSLSEILNPYEFWHYRNTWDELKAFYIAGGRKSPESVLDYKLGNDFSVSKNAKGMRLDKQDSSPIFAEDEPKAQEYIKKITALMKPPRVSIPDMKQLEIFAQKVQEAANKHVGASDEHETGYRRSKKEPVSEDDTDDISYDNEDTAPAARRGSARQSVLAEDREEAVEPAPVRRGTTTKRAAQSVDEENGAAEEAPAVTRRSPPVAGKPAVTRPKAAPVQETEPEEEQEPEVQPRSVARQTAPVQRTLAPTARRQVQQAEPVEQAPQEEAEEDQLPEEASDPAPAEEPEADPAPPAVTRKGSLSTDIKSRLATVKRGM